MRQRDPPLPGLFGRAAVVVLVLESIGLSASLCAVLVQGALKEAAELCNTVLGGAPRNARALYLRAAVLKSEGKGHEATEAACEAARLRPDLAPLQLAAGSLLYREKRYAPALELYERAIEEDPGVAQYHLGGK